MTGQAAAQSIDEFRHGLHDLFQKSGRWDDALGVAEDILRMARDLPPTEAADHQCYAYSYMVDIFRKQAKWEELADTAQAYLDVARESGRPTSELRALNALSSAYEGKRNMRGFALTAQDYFECAVRAGDQREASLAVSHMEAARDMLEQDGDLKTQEEVARRSLTFAIEQGDGYRRIRSYIALIPLLKQQKKWDEVAEFAQQHLEFARSIGYKKEQYFALKHASHANIELENWPEVERLQYERLGLAISECNKRGLTDAYADLMDAIMKQGTDRSIAQASVVDYWIENARTVSDPEMRQEVFGKLRQVLWKQDDWSELEKACRANLECLEGTARFSDIAHTRNMLLIAIRQQRDEGKHEEFDQLRAEQVRFLNEHPEIVDIGAPPRWDERPISHTARAVRTPEAGGGVGSPS